MPACSRNARRSCSPPGGRVDDVRRSLYPSGEHTFVKVVERGGAMFRNGSSPNGSSRSGTTSSSTSTGTATRRPCARSASSVGLASPSTVHAHLANLERAGLLRRDPTKPRALELIGRERREPAEAARRSADVVRLPLLGEIAAGGPLLAEQNIEEYVPMPSRAKGDFLLRVKGDSMIEAGILDGDLVIVQRAQDARNGEIVVALAGDDDGGRRGDREDLLPRGRPHPAPAREPRARADLRAARPDPGTGRRSLSRALTDERRPDDQPMTVSSLRSTARSTRSSPRCCEARRSSAWPAASS